MFVVANIEPPQLTFKLADLESVIQMNQNFDVIIANAALHWIPGHLTLQKYFRFIPTFYKMLMQWWHGSGVLEYKHIQINSPTRT